MTHVTPQWMIEQGFSPTFAERFWFKVEKTESCWIWTAYRNRHGYGGINTGHKPCRMVLASRASWMIHFGPIPKGMDVCHDCPGGDNPSCVRPDHLWIGDEKANMSDASKKGRLSYPRAKGEASSHHVLTQIDADEIRRLWDVMPHIKLASMFGISYTHAWRIHRGDLWI